MTMHRPTPLSTLLPPHFPGQDLGIALEFLASHGISTGPSTTFPFRGALSDAVLLGTDVEFLFGPEVLPPHRTLSPEFLALLRSLASSNLCASRTNGAEFLYRMVLPRRTSTSVPSLDRFLEGEGFPEGDLIELVGTPSSGRTVLSLYASLLYLLVNPARRAAYLDSKGNFDPFRCLAILKKVLIPRLRDRGHVFSAVKKGEEDGTGEAGTDDEVAMDVLDRISISRVTKSGQALDKIAEDQANETATKLGIVVIDQIDDLLGGEALTKKSAQGELHLAPVPSDDPEPLRWLTRIVLLSLMVRKRPRELDRVHAQVVFPREIDHFASHGSRRDPYRFILPMPRTFL